MKKALSIAVSAAMLFSLSACGSNETIAETPSPTVTELQASVETAAVDSSIFTKRDSSTDYDEAAAQYIDLDAQTGDITLTEAGDYVLSGTLSDGSVIINAPEDAKLHLILNGAHIASQSAAVLYVISADKVFVTLADGSENGISAAGDSAEDDYANVDAAIFARCDISFNGSGSLSVSSAKGRGIVSKDDLVFTGGSYMIQAANHGISGKDSIRIAQMTHEAGAFTVFITKFMQTPAAPYADVLLCSGATEGPIQGGSISGVASQMYIVMLLYSELFRRMETRAQENKIKAAHAIAERKL